MIEIDREAIKAVAEKHGLDLVVLFGSQVTGRTHAKSDVDIGYFPSSRSFDQDGRLFVEMTEAIRRGDLDLINMRQVSPLLLKQIVDKGLVLFESRPGGFEEFVLYVFRVYREIRALRQLEKDYVIRRTNEYARQLSL